MSRVTEQIAEPLTNCGVFMQVDNSQIYGEKPVDFCHTLLSRI